MEKLYGKQLEIMATKARLLGLDAVHTAASGHIGGSSGNFCGRHPFPGMAGFLGYGRRHRPGRLSSEQEIHGYGKAFLKRKCRK